MGTILIFLFLTIPSSYVDSSRILAAMPTPSYSHQVFFQQLWKELAVRGHEVVVLTTNPTHENIFNLREIDMSAIYELCGDMIPEFIALNEDKLTSISKHMDGHFKLSVAGLQVPQVEALINDPKEHFDLVMIEYLFPMFYAFKHRFNCPFIGVISTDAHLEAHEAVGNSIHPILFPSDLLPTIEDLSFRQRVFSVMFMLISLLTRRPLYDRINAEIETYFGTGYPDIGEIANSVDMLFVNNNPIVSHIRPLTPNTISIYGGMHLKAPQPLPEDLQRFLDDSEMGVVYFSLGGNVKSTHLSNHTISIIVDTFATLPYNVLWKFEESTLPGKPSNVFIRNWFPQQDVLRHKNIKLFVMQAGKQSIEEAVFNHVPMLTMPIFFDQDANSAKIVKQHLGLQLDYKRLTREAFTDAIFEVIENEMYVNNVKKLANEIRDQPMPPLEKAVWWTEYVLRHNGAKHLRGRKIPTYQYYLLDVLGFLFISLLAACGCIFILCKFVGALLNGGRIKLKIM